MRAVQPLVSTPTHEIAANQANEIPAAPRKDSLSQLVTDTLNPRERVLRAAVIDAMTTNETLWFRDSYPFELLKNKQNFTDYVHLSPKGNVILANKISDKIKSILRK